MILAIIIPILYLMGWLSTIRFVIERSKCGEAFDRQIQGILIGIIWPIGMPLYITTHYAERSRDSHRREEILKAREANEVRVGEIVGRWPSPERDEYFDRFGKPGQGNG